MLYVDDSAGQQYQVVRFVLQNPDNRKLAYALKYAFTTNKNESEYEALIARLHMALALNVEQLIIRVI